MARCIRADLWSVLGVVALTMTVACGSSSGVSTDRADAAPATTTTDDPPIDPPTTTATEPTDPPTTDATEPSETAPSVPPDPPQLDWQEFDEDTETALLEVPVDYDDPTAGTFELFVARHLATDQENKIGSLLVNPGGPGFGGSEFGLYAEFVFGEELLERFDIIGWDPRGTGLSEPAIDCIDDYDKYFAGYDVTPDDDAERQQVVDIAEDLTTACVTKNADILEHVGTNDSARDMDSLRRALGEDQISYFGFSYGSELGATWATMFPDTVRAAVIDGASDPTAGQFEDGLQQVKGFEDTVATYLADCSADSTCAFHNGGNAEGAFDALMAELDEAPIPSEPGRPDVDRGMARQAVAQAMYSDTFWEQLSEALADAQRGEGAGLLAMYDSYFQRRPDGTWGNELEAFQTIRCMDSAERPTVAESDARAPEMTAVAPRMAPFTTGDYFCTFFPPTSDPRAEITAAGAGPIVVIGTTGDPATPLASTRTMATTLEDGRLIVVTADKHGGYGVGSCADDLVHAYLVDLEAPPVETTC